MAHQGLHMAHLPAALSFLHKISASCHSVSLIKKSEVLKRFLGVTLAVNQIIAELLANSLQPFSVLNNKWIIDFFILPRAPAPAPFAAAPSPLCQQPHSGAWAFCPSPKPRCKWLLVGPTGKSLPAFKMKPLWAISFYFR